MASSCKQHKITLNDGAIIDVQMTMPVNHAPSLVWLFFNGAFCNLHLWDSVLDELTSSGFGVLQHDVRGAGKSKPASVEVFGSEQFTFDQYADDACVILDHLDLQKVCVCGAAWGSRAAAVFAARHPERCSGCVLTDFSVGTADVNAQKSGRQLARRKLLSMGEEIPKSKAAYVHDSFHLVKLAMHATGKAPYNVPAGFTSIVLAIRHPFPVKIITGEFDPNLIATPGGSDESFAALRAAGNSSATLVVLPAVGHLAIADRPALVVAELISFGCDVTSKKSRL